jgi:hypothetical protein
MNVTVKMLRRLLALAVAGALAATAVTALTGGSPSSAADPVQDTGAPSVAQQEETFEANFALLRSPGGSSIPATAQIDDPGLQVTESRQVTLPASRALARTSAGGDADPQVPDATTVWVIPKDDGTQCLIAYMWDVRQLGGNCATVNDALTARMVMTVSRDGHEAEIVGVVPDGVDEVTVTLADGSSADLPVVDNAYIARFDRATASVRWTDADGVVQSAEIGSGG